MAATQRQKCFLFFALLLAIFIGGIDWLSMHMVNYNSIYNMTQPANPSSNTLAIDLIFNYTNYPSCARIHIERLNNDYYLYSNYKKSFFILNDHHTISIKFFIYTPHNTILNQCVAIYTEERLQFLSNHPNRVYNISKAEVIIMNMSTLVDWAYPCNAPNYDWRWIEKKYVSKLDYIWIRKNNSKHYCLYDDYHLYLRDIYDWLAPFYDLWIKQYPNIAIFIFINGHIEHYQTVKKTHIIRGAVDLQTSSFRNNLDIAMPPPLMNELHFGEHMRHKNKMNQDDCKRKYFATFQGTLKSYQTQRDGNRFFWRSLLKYWHSENDGLIIRNENKKNDRYNHAKYEYSEFMLNSYFNFAPRGACIYTFRFREILHYGRGGAILLADGYVLPFDNVIDWEYHIQQRSIVIIDETTFENYTKNIFLGQETNITSKKHLFQQLFVKDWDSLDKCKIQQNVKELQLYFNGIASETQTLLLAIQERLNLFKKTEH